jgi:hypothetical protein
MWIFAPKIALRTDGSDPARNHLFRTDFLNACLQCSQFLRNCWKFKAVYQGHGESID